MKTKKIVVSAMMIAMVAVATMIIRIPTPATQGYVNMGDALIFVSALLFGPKIGFIAGGLGSALADILAGYTNWAPWTFVIKGLEGFIAGFLVYRLSKSDNLIINIISLVVAGLWMAVGYFIASSIMYGTAAALTDFPSNILQATAGIVVGLPLAKLLGRIDYIKNRI